MKWYELQVIRTPDLDTATSLLAIGARYIGCKRTKAGTFCVFALSYYPWQMWYVKTIGYFRMKRWMRKRKLLKDWCKEVVAKGASYVQVI